MDFEIPSKGIILINLEDGQPVAMQEKEAFILGRASSEIKTQVPLVDLTSLGLDYGISRTHALIRQTKSGYEITDLNSSNGTWLENERLVPQKSYQVESGNRVRMGRLNVLVYYPKVS
jgi:pSer/pThr/pTyr-binding forkhead associated (FHA) protein